MEFPKVAIFFWLIFRRRLLKVLLRCLFFLLEWKQEGGGNIYICIYIYTPSRELTHIPPKGKAGKSASKVPFEGDMSVSWSMNDYVWYTLFSEVSMKSRKHPRYTGSIGVIG